MFKTFANSYQLINLLDNGAFEYIGDPVPFWTVTGAGIDARGNKYSLTDESGPIYKAISFQLSESDPVTLIQSFGPDVSGVMDFKVPLASGQRSSVVEGYQTTERKVIPHQHDMTFAFEASAESGSAYIALELGAITPPNSVATTTIVGSKVLTVNLKEWSRYVFKFSSSHPVRYIGLRIIRASSDQHTVIKLSKMALFNGHYESAPYTGDLMARAIPKGALILWQGTTCPAGFYELGEGDETPNPEWVEDQPDIKARKGNYPRASEPAGQVLHTAENTFIKPGNAQIELFEPFEGKFVQKKKKGTNPGIDLAGSTGLVDIPDEFGNPSHSHELEPSDTRPASIGFLFCQRL